MPHRFLEHFLRRNGVTGSNGNGLSLSTNTAFSETNNNQSSNSSNSVAGSGNGDNLRRGSSENRSRTSRCLGNLFTRISTIRRSNLADIPSGHDKLLFRLVDLLPGTAWLQCRHCNTLLRDPVAVFYSNVSIEQQTKKDKIRKSRKQEPDHQRDTTLFRCDGWEALGNDEKIEQCYQEEDIGNGEGCRVLSGLLRPYCRSCAMNASINPNATISEDRAALSWVGRVIDVSLLRVIDHVNIMAVEINRTAEEQEIEVDEAVTSSSATATAATMALNEAALTAIAECFRPRLLEDLQCDICRNLLHRPIMTPCGHTFCRSCLERAHDHSQICPTCRRPLPSPVVLFTQGKHHLLAALVRLWFPRESKERGEMALKDEPTGHFVNYNFHVHGALIPIFVCALVFPGMPCYLHIFEPRYRLLIRRCWMGSRRFGMVCSWPPVPEGEAPPSDRPLYRDYGTMLWIERVRFLPDGRMVVLTRAERYFRVMRIEPQLDGYNMASVMWVDDADIPQRFGLINMQEREHDEIVLAHSAIEETDGQASPCDNDDMEVDGLLETDEDLNTVLSSRQVSSSGTRSELANSNASPSNDATAVALGASLLAAAATVSNTNTYPNSTSPATATVISSSPSYHPSFVLDPNLLVLSQLIYTRMMEYRQQITNTQLQQIDHVYGTMPDNNAQALSFWAASVVPIDKHIRYKALLVGSVHNRLLLISEWLDALDRMHQNWWRASGCAVM